jgi:hypothetical protein
MGVILDMAREQVERLRKEDCLYPCTFLYSGECSCGRVEAIRTLWSALHDSKISDHDALLVIKLDACGPVRDLWAEFNKPLVAQRTVEKEK